MPMGKVVFCCLNHFEFIFFNRLFLGPCKSVRVAEVMTQSFDPNSPKVALRFNSIEVNYEAIANLSVFGRTIQLKTCAVRVGIYNRLSFELFYFFS